MDEKRLNSRISKVMEIWHETPINRPSLVDHGNAAISTVRCTPEPPWTNHQRTTDGKKEANLAIDALSNPAAMGPSSHTSCGACGIPLLRKQRQRKPGREKYKASCTFAKSQKSMHFTFSQVSLDTS
jgi:hypothetical protein